MSPLKKQTMGAKGPVIALSVPKATIFVQSRLSAVTHILSRLKRVNANLIAILHCEFRSWIGGETEMRFQ